MSKCQSNVSNVKHQPSNDHHHHHICHRRRCRYAAPYTYKHTHTHMDLTLDFHSIYVCRVIFFLPIKSYLMYFSTMKKKHVKTYVCVCVMFSRILFSLSTVNIYSVQSFGWPKHVNNNKIKIKIGKKYETYIQNIVNHVVIAAGYTEK